MALPTTVTALPSPTLALSKVPAALVVERVTLPASAANTPLRAGEFFINCAVASLSYCLLAAVIPVMVRDRGLMVAVTVVVAGST